VKALFYFEPQVKQMSEMAIPQDNLCGIILEEIPKGKNMQTINGKYNSANVMIDEIDETTRSQIQGFVNNPSFAGPYIAIMPDCHAGAGSCIGFTMQMNDRIIPDVVGVDIGCGMLSAKFNVEAFDIPSFDAFVKAHIPSGFSVNADAWRGEDFFTNTVKKIGMDEARAIRSIGTLGGGNHFIEAGYGDDGKLWVTIHSGSRNFGLQIAKYHSAKAKELCSKWGADTQGIPFLIVDSPEGQDYINDQVVGVRYASENRIEMMRRLIEFFGKKPIDVIESVHNFIGEYGMIRKGATPAHEGQRVIIPFNMRDGLAICKGKGSKKYNYSAPHGAGRILSRTKAKETLDVQHFQEDMRQAGVFTTTANASTLDEAPGAYKDKAIILENIEETVEIIEFVKPVYNFKAGAE
jgi:tRNA-splicing ligase RtcB (3'-phosphate/5'-hydroxy nucleic acid ligase)